MRPHVHAEVIRAWADGARIEYRTDAGMMWEEIDRPHFDIEFEYRVKPEMTYPQTEMPIESLRAAWEQSGVQSGLKAVANAAIRHAITRCSAEIGRAKP